MKNWIEILRVKEKIYREMKELLKLFVMAVL